MERRKSLGLSLVELTMFIVIVGAAVAGIIGVIAVTTRSSADPMIHKQALAIAEAVLEEVQLQPFTYCDPDDPGAATTDSGGAPIAVDAVSSNSVGASSSSLTISNHPTSGSNRLMLVGISISNDGTGGAGNRQITSVTYNGVSLGAAVCTGSVVDDARVWIYKLIAPPVTTANVVITLDGTVSPEGSIYAGVMTFTGVDQTTPLGTCVTDTNDLAPHEVTVTSATNELVFDVYASEDATMTMVASPAGRTQRWNLTANTDGGGGSTAPGASSVTMTWTANAGSTHWAVAAVPIKPGGGCPNLTEAIGPETYASVTETRYSTDRPFDNVNDYHGFDSNTAVPSGIRNIDSTLIAGLEGYRVTVSVAAQPLGAIGNDAFGNPQSLLITVAVTGPGNTTVTLNGYRTRYAPNDLP